MQAIPQAFLCYYLQNNVVAHKSSMPLKKQFLSTTRQRKDVIFFPVVLETWHTNDMYIKRLKNSYRSSSSVSPLVFFSWFFFFLQHFCWCCCRWFWLCQWQKKKRKRSFGLWGECFSTCTPGGLRGWNLLTAGAVSQVWCLMLSQRRSGHGGRVAAASPPPPRGRTSDSPHRSEAPLPLSPLLSPPPKQTRGSSTTYMRTAAWARVRLRLRRCFGFFFLRRSCRRKYARKSMA